MLIPDDNNESQKVTLQEANSLILESLSALGRFGKKIEGIFKSNNMETKEMKIVPPEGYEIDKENSTFECVKFKPIKKAVSYEDVAKELFLNKTSFFTDTFGEIIPCENTKIGLLNPNTGTSEKQMQKLLAINKLMNVAKYLNGKDWKPDWDNGEKGKYYIYHQNGKFNIDYVYSYTTMNIYFKSEEAAQQAIDILGEETIRLALSTDY